MTVQQLIRYIRLNVTVVDPDDECCTDRAYLELTDDDIRLYLEVCLTRDFSDVPCLEQLPNSCVYPLTLLVKKELYYAFAVYRAPEVDMNADMNNSLRRSQRFEHYLALIKEVEGEYQNWLDNGGSSADGYGNNVLRTYDVLLPNTRYFTKRYYEKAVAPQPRLYVDDFTSESIELRWENRVNQFAWTNVYVSKEELIDEYQEGLSKVIDGDENLAFRTLDARQTTLRLTGLDPDTTYYIVAEVTDKSGLKGFSQVSVHTREPVSEDVP